MNHCLYSNCIPFILVLKITSLLLSVILLFFYCPYLDLPLPHHFYHISFLLLSFLISFLRILLTSSFCNDFSTFSNLLRPQAHLTIFFFVIFQFLLQILLFINKLDLDDNNIQICFMNGGISLSIRDRACDILYKYSLCVCMVKDSEEDVVVWELYTQSNHFPGGGCVQARILANLYHYHITQ